MHIQKGLNARLRSASDTINDDKRNLKFLKWLISNHHWDSNVDRLRIISEYASPVRSSDTSDSNSGSCQAPDMDPNVPGQKPTRPIEKLRKPGKRAKGKADMFCMSCISTTTTTSSSSSSSLTFVNAGKIPFLQYQISSIGDNKNVAPNLLCLLQMMTVKH